MRMSWGTGPVFAFESLIATRRWQTYALRCAYVGLLLFGLTLTWGPSEQTIRTLAEAARIAGMFFRTLIAVQLAVVLLAAPAATASAVCVDKSRGTLLHAFVTDLTDREIVLGKLGARLIPVLSLLACGLPVLAIGSFLGGLDLAAAVGAELVTVGTAVFCCSVALLASVWARKPHQSLLLAYVVVGVWVAVAPLALALFSSGPPATPGAVIVVMSNPIFAAFAPDLSAPTWLLGLNEQFIFFLGALLIASALAQIAILRLRSTVLGQVSRPVNRARPDAPARLLDYLPGPSLDRNAILWREWHRKRPSRWTGRFWTAYAIASAVASVYVLAWYYLWPDNIGYRNVHVIAAQVNAWQVSIGLLLLSVSAATTLAEERDRGSLEVIMTTPLTAREIVWGKWWGTIATVPRLAILPIWVGIGAAMVSGGGDGFILMVGLLLAYAAAITSFGLAVATWIKRLGPVVVINVVAYVLIAAGWPLILEVVPALMFQVSRGDLDGLFLASPFFGIYATTERASRLSNFAWGDTAWNPLWTLFWIGAYSAAAVILAFATLLTFDRCMGRAVEREEPA
jgi:ABC-type transport system involved in multi-copper enzyme maturation permease subunit